MKRTAIKVMLLAAMNFIIAGSASASITTIKGTLACFVGCNRDVVQKIAQGETFAFEVVGQFVDTSTSVEITGGGVDVSYGTRKHGSGSSIIVKFDLTNGADPGERTVRMRYAIETNGPDTFKVRVVRKGSVTSITPATAPLNQVVHLVLTGTRLDHIEIRDTSSIKNVSVLAGATSGRAEVDLEFTANGAQHLQVYDSALTQNDMISGTASKFVYDGSLTLAVTAGTGIQAPATFINPPLTSSVGAAPALFIDIAPKATMTNIFRRRLKTASFTENGVAFFEIDFQNACSGMSGNQSKVITIPNPIWGASNVGTANVATGFQSQLRNGGAVLQTGDVAPLNTGATQNFTFTRASSTVRVFTFLTHGGCFVSPTANEFFEDPSFTVVVNTNGTVADSNTTNNTRNY
jgi:hypothetical protein